MRGELVGEAADLAPAHRIGLPGQRERPHAGPPDPPGRQVAVDDGVDLVGAADGLVDPLRIERHHALGAREQIVEGAQHLGIEVRSRPRRSRSERRRSPRAPRSASVKARDMCRRSSPRSSAPVSADAPAGR